MEKVNVKYGENLVAYTYDKNNDCMGILSSNTHSWTFINNCTTKSDLSNVLKDAHINIIPSFILDIGTPIFILRNIILPDLVYKCGEIDGSSITFDYYGGYIMIYRNGKVKKDYVGNRFWL